MRAQLAAERWQSLGPGVYATFTGDVSRRSQLWAAVLACGSGAVLSHRTALELYGVGGTSTQIHVSVPHDRRVVPPSGVLLHRSTKLPGSRHPTLLPPRTRVEDAVLDTSDVTGSAGELVDLLSRACQRRRTTADRLRTAAAARPRLRWRRLVDDVLADVGSGAESPLELRYLQEVERRHGLPRGRRQHADRAAMRTLWRDVAYPEYGVVVELDGAATRPQEIAFRDWARDNIAAERGQTAVRYGWRDVAGRPCVVAAQVARVLRLGGWDGAPVGCSLACAAVLNQPGGYVRSSDIRAPT